VLAAAHYEESPAVAANRCDDHAARLGASHIAFVRVHSIRGPRCRGIQCSGTLYLVHPWAQGYESQPNVFDGERA